jgi:SAM-dependent methyltransferase
MNQRRVLQAIWDFVGIPFRLVLFDQSWLPHFGWTTLESERLEAVLPLIRGRLLDIGAGPNTLVNRYGNGVGVDVVDWGGGALVVENTSKLPFDAGTFDTIALVACLNHIPYRDAVVRECRRLLRPNGRVIVTMIDPILGGIGHAVWWYSEDKRRGGMVEGEVGGLWNSSIVRLFRAEGFRLSLHKRFVYRLNNLFLFEVEP